jgi:hypothetical protein
VHDILENCELVSKASWFHWNTRSELRALNGWVGSVHVMDLIANFSKWLVAFISGIDD